MSLHETFDRKEDIKIASERSFGLTIGVVLLLISLWPLLDQGELRQIPLGMSALFFILGLLCPKTLKPLNFLWFKLGELLFHITNPIILFIIFFIFLTPMALLKRLFSGKPKNIILDKNASSYWIKRDNPTISPESFNNQF